MARAIAAPSIRSISEVQQDFANNLGHQRDIIWDLLSAEQSDILKEKIRQWIPDPNSHRAISDLIDVLKLSTEQSKVLWKMIKPLLLDEQKITNAINELHIELELSPDDKNKLKENINKLADYDATIDETIKNLFTILQLSAEKKLILIEKINELMPDDNKTIKTITENLIMVLALPTEKSNLLKKEINKLLRNQKKNRISTKEMRETLYTSVWAQRKYTNLNSMTAIIFVCVTKEEENVIGSHQYSCHLVFRCRKCTDNSAERDSSNCCMIFVDETGRVYANWDAYVSNNVLPAGKMVAPKRGVYTFDETGIVELEMQPTPADGLLHQSLQVADRTSAIAGFGSALVPIAALCAIPVAAPVLVASSAVAIATGAYGSIRSGANLYDRSSHEQSISVTNRQARGSWLGMAGGIVGATAAGATRALSYFSAAGGEVAVATELVVNGMNITTMLLSGTGVVHGIVDMILRFNDDEKIEILDVVQLAASFVLFTHSVYNFRLASTIINESRDNTIKDYRNNLSNRQRRAFDKLAKETIRIRGHTAGKMDIIRNVNEIPSKQYLNDLYKVNRNLNQRNVRPAFRATSTGTGDSGIVLNNEMHVDTQFLRGNIDVLAQITQPIPTSHAQMDGPNGAIPNKLFSTNTQPFKPINTAANLSYGVATLSSTIVLVKDGVRFSLSDVCVNLFRHIYSAQSFEDIVTTIGDRFGGECLKYFLRLANIFVEMMLDGIEKILGSVIPAESILHRLVMHCVREYSNMALEYLEGKSLEILEAVKAYFISLNPNCPNSLLEKCKNCAGYYNICNL